MSLMILILALSSSINMNYLHDDLVPPGGPSRTWQFDCGLFVVCL